MSHLLLLLESSCPCPPKKKKRRNQTWQDRLSAEMRDMFTEMNRDFDERERLRLLEQRQYEEQVRREARAERAQEMVVLQEMTSLLRQMVQRVPATQPQYPQCEHLLLLVIVLGFLFYGRSPIRP